MINIGNFFALAQAQLDRCLGGTSGDLTLCTILPKNHHPTKGGEVRELMGLISPEDHMLFAAACAWLGRTMPAAVVDYYKDPDVMEARARLADAGALSAPADAPCRTYPWERIRRLVDTRRLSSPVMYARFEGFLGPYTRKFLADVRHLCSEPDEGPWMNPTAETAKGLAWVEDDCGIEGGYEIASVVANRLLTESGQYWFNVPAPAWTIDTIAFWAAVCHRYVEARRKL